MQPELPSRRWTGAANVPTRHARMNGTWPLGELRLHGDRLTVRLRPVLGWVPGLPLDAAIEDIALVFPTKINMVSRIGIRHRDGREWYFSAGSSEDREIRAALTRAGFPATDEFIASKAWSLKP